MCREIGRALAEADEAYSVADVIQGAERGEFQVWLNGRSVLVTEVIRYPLCKALRCFAAGGRMRELLDMQTDVENWGRQHGCSRIEMCGRKGWEKVFTDARCRQVLMVKDL